MALDIEHPGGHQRLRDSEGREVAVGEGCDLVRRQVAGREHRGNCVNRAAEQGDGGRDKAPAGAVLPGGVARQDEFGVSRGKGLQCNEVEEPVDLDPVEEDGAEQGPDDNAAGALQAQGGFDRVQRGKEAGDEDEDAVGDPVDRQRDDDEGDGEGKKQQRGAKSGTIRTAQPIRMARTPRRMVTIQKFS